MLYYKIPKDQCVRIETPNRNIDIIVREIHGTKTTRSGEIEVIGSPLITEDSNISLTSQYLKLDENIEIRVSAQPSSASALRIQFNVLPEYRFRKDEQFRIILGYQK